MKFDKLDRMLKSELFFRFHHNANKILSIGFTDWDLTKKSYPTKFSLWGLTEGSSLGLTTKVFGGLSVTYDTELNYLSEVKSLWGFKYYSFRMFVEGILRQSKLIRSSDTVDNAPIYNKDKLVKVKFDSKVVDDLRLSGDIDFNLNTNSIDMSLVTRYVMSPLTVLKTKVSTDNTLTMGIQHIFHNSIIFGFVNKLTLNKGKRATPPLNENILTSIGYSMGVILEFNDI